MKKTPTTEISDYFITGFVFAVGIIFTIVVASFSGSSKAFFDGFQYAPIYFLYYLWIKGMVMDMVRIKTSSPRKIRMPGFVYFAYLLQWFVYWQIDDISRSSASGITWLYFTHNFLFWIILDAVSSIVLYPLQKQLQPRKDINDFIIMDLVKSVVLFNVFALLSVGP